MAVKDFDSLFMLYDKDESKVLSSTGYTGNESTGYTGNGNAGGDTVTPSAINEDVTSSKSTVLSDLEKDSKDAWDAYFDYGDFNFDFDVNEDELYLQYADMYSKNAEKAMKDAIAKSASLTGGYANSWSQSAGQQAYQGVMDNLGEVALEIEDRAYDREYDKWLNERSGLLEKAEYADSRIDYYNTKTSEGLSYVQGLLASGITPTDEDIAASGLTTEQFAELQSIYSQALTVAAEAEEDGASFGEFTATEFCDKMSALSVIYTGDGYTAEEKKQAFTDAYALLEATGGTESAMTIFALYFEPDALKEMTGQRGINTDTLFGAADATAAVYYDGFTEENDPHKFANGINDTFVSILKGNTDIVESLSKEEKATLSEYWKAFLELPYSTQIRMLDDAGFTSDEIDDLFA